LENCEHKVGPQEKLDEVMNDENVEILYEKDQMIERRSEYFKSLLNLKDDI
jgi:hypothetical protein